jgi:hypothetical protein
LSQLQKPFYTLVVGGVTDIYGPRAHWDHSLLKN